MRKNFTRTLLLPVLLFLGLSMSFAQTGTGLSFDGIKDYVQIADNNLLDFGSGNFTIETWVNKKANSSGFSNSGVVAKWNTGGAPGTNEWLLQTSGPNGNSNLPSFWIEAGTTIYQCNATTLLQLNVWYHLAAVRDGASLKIYVNGVLEGTLAIPANTVINNKNLNMTLGAYRLSSSPIFSKMSMDELRIWNRALCAEEILNNKGCELNPAGQTGLVALYHFNDGIANGDNTGITVPGAPTTTNVTASSSQAKVDFVPPASNGGAAITQYTITSDPDGLTATGASSPITINGLTNGRAYTFTVSATNSAGTGPSSASTLQVMPTGVPSSPQSIDEIRTGNGQATLYFIGSSSNGGLAIGQYTVTSIPGGHTATGFSPITINGLTNGVAYTFTVSATNSAGTGPSVTSNSPVTPTGLPSAPSITSAFAHDGSATINFSGSSDNGGLAIIEYIVTSVPGGNFASGSTTPITVSGLTNGQSYTFTVAARNSNGIGTSSAPSNPVVPTGAPGQPTISSVAAGNGYATISFNAPTSNGGLSISSYIVTSSPGSFTASGTSSPLTISGLTNGQSYTFTVQAINAAGTGPASLPSTNGVIPIGVPSAPQVTGLQPGNSQIVVSFSTPSDNGGSTVSSYTVTASPGGASQSGSSSPITVSGLTNGQAYTFTVTASNAAGSSPVSAPSASAVPTGTATAPVITAVTAGNASATVAFNSPTSNGGSPVISYTVTSNPGSLTKTGAASPLVINGLTNGQAYTFTVFATTAAGNSPNSAPSSPGVTPLGAPGAPAINGITPGNKQVTISISAPASNGGTIITQYTATSVPGGFSASGSGTTLIVSGLTNGQSYTFTVTATNSVGTGSASAASSSVVPVGPPTSPAVTLVTPGNVQVSVAFSAPSSNGGSPVTSYTVTSNPGGIVVAGTASPIIVSGLTNGTPYTFIVTASNALGTSPPSASSAPATPQGVPSAPSITGVSSGNAQVTVNFSAPSSNGGSAILDYTATSNPGGFTKTGTASPLIVSGLTNGQSYTFTVRARNTNGLGALSATSSSVTPATIPSAGAILSVTGADASAVISFSQTSFNGGSPIIRYVITASPGGLTQNANASPFIFTGLTNGNYYTFTVKAVNALGTGPASPASLATFIQPAITDVAQWRIAVPNDNLGCDVDPMTGLGVRADGSEFDPILLNTIIPARIPNVPVYRFPLTYIVTFDPDSFQLLTMRYSIVDLEAKHERDFNGNILSLLTIDALIYYVTTDGRCVDTQNDQIQFNPGTFEVLAAGEPYTIADTPTKFRIGYQAFLMAMNLENAGKEYVPMAPVGIPALNRYKNTRSTVITDQPSYVTGPYDYSNTTPADHIEFSGNISYLNTGVTNPTIAGLAPAFSAGTAAMTLTDGGPNHLDGTLHGFTLTGSVSNWTTGIANGTCSLFTAPTTPITGINAICTGSTSTLSNTTTGGSWSSNNASVATVNAAGVVSGVTAGTATISYTNKCGGISTVTVTVNALPAATISAGGSTSFCSGGSVTLTASAGSSYLWSTGAITQAITTSTAGSYSVTVTNALSCSAASAATVVSVNSFPVVSQISTGVTAVDYLIAAGGGGGASGGGGGGGVLSGTNLSISANQSISITVGAGGSAGVGGALAGSRSTSGGNSVFASFTAIGGGGGGGNGSQLPLAGGSGGGGGFDRPDITPAAGTTGQGNAGGRTNFGGYGAGAGGGGAGTAGSDAPVLHIGGNGGNGISSAISGAAAFYGGGGGGGINDNNNATTPNGGGTGGSGGGGNGSSLGFTCCAFFNGTSGTPATGGGGGGTDPESSVAGAGGSGIVIIRYSGIPSATGGTITQSGGYTIHTFTNVGSNTFKNNSGNSVCVGATTTYTNSTAGGAWSSSNTAIATVDNTGSVTGISAGTAVISYTVTNANNCSTAVTAGITVNALPTATISGTTSVCRNAGAPAITFTGANATAPYTFTYTINGGAQQTITSPGNTATINVPTAVAGNFVYALVSVKDAGATVCSNTATGSATVTINPAPVFTTCPSNRTANSATKCNVVVNYTAAATGSPAPTLSYTFSGATTGSGSGTGSGQSFNIGVTTVTISAASACGTVTCTFTVTVTDSEAPVFAVPANILANVPEASQFQLIYKLPIPNVANWDASSVIPYSINNAAALASNSFSRIAYYLELDGKWVWVSMDKFTNNVALTGIPTGTTIFQQKVNNLNVLSSAGAGVTNGNNIATGNIEIWSYCYTQNSAISIPGASGAVYDFGDAINANVDCYGSFQVHNYGAAQTILAYNRWSDAANNISDLGIGNNTGNVNPDWTFMSNANGITTKNLYVFITGGIRNITANTDAGQCAATVSVTAPLVSDNCGTPAVTGTRSDNLALTAAYPKGVTTITWTATDASANTSTTSQTVTVTDNQLPVISCTGNISVNAASADGAVVTYTAPVGTDNCSGASTVRTAGLASGSTFPIGTTTITHTVTDAAGLTASCSFTVTVTGLAPVIVCPSNITVDNIPGQCNAIANFAATETTGIPASVITYSIAPGSSFGIGTVAVTATATNAVNVSRCIFYITVRDNELPVLDAVTDMAVNNDPGKCGAAIAIIAPLANDNCGVASVIGVRSDGSLLTDDYPVGTTVITWTATDIHDNTATVLQNIVVTDNETPIITQPGDISVSAEAGTCDAAVDVVAPAITDNCGFSGGTTATYTKQFTKEKKKAPKKGAVKLKKTAQSADEEPTPPTPEPPTPEPPASAPPAAPPASAPPASAPPASAPPPAATARFDVGVTTLTWTVTDIHGNSSTVTQTITVTDDQAPTISGLSAVIHVNADAGNCAATNVDLGTPETADNCGVESVDNNAPDLYPVGETTVTWTVTDIHGNQTEFIQTVVVTDAELPIITAPGAVSVSADASSCAAANVTLGDAITNDNCGVAAVSNDAPASFPAGTTTVIWTVTDIHGNMATAIQIVAVTDNEVPVPDVANLPIVTGECSATVTAAPTARDNCAGRITGTTHDPLTYTTQGTYIIIWTFDDGHLNIITQTQTVIVNDVTRPVPDAVTLPTITGECFATVTAAPTATDNCSGSLTGRTGDPLTYSTQGTHIITWTFDDGHHNITTQTQAVKVIDVTFPVLVGIPANATAECNAIPARALVTATDNCATSIPSYTEIKTNGSCPGNYTLTRTWSTTDIGGNTTTSSQVITVRDIQKPILSEAPGNMIVECNAVPLAATLTATDNCSTPKVVFSETRTDGSSLYNYTLTRTWTATDSCGNSCSKTQVITVQDTKAPVVSLPANINLSNDNNICGATVNFAATATDNCSPVTITYSKDPGTLFAIGSTTVNVTAKDLAGNTATGSFTITVTDSQKPAITAVPNQVFCANISGSNYSIPVLAATDNCGILTTGYAITGATSRSGSGTNASGTFNAGLSTITWTVTDINNNVSTSITTVAINTLPVASIAASNADAFCNKVTLTAASTINPATYRWISGSSSFAASQQVSLGQTNGDGIYSVFVTDAITGCTSAVAAAYNFQKQNLAASYTILTYKDMEMGKYNKVATGSVGVMTTKGQAEFKSYSSVTGVGSFVKAPKIDKDGTGINITTSIIGLASVTLPTMQYNSASAKYLSNYTASTQNATLTANYNTLTVKKGISVTVSGNIFGTIKLEEGASIKFTNPVLNIDQLTVDKGAKDGYYSYVRFAPNTSVRISSKVSIGSQVQVNPESNKVTFYMGDLKSDDEKFTVKGGDTKVIANIFMPDGKLRVTATDSDDDDDHDACDHKAHSSWNCKHKGHDHNDCDHKAHSASNCGDDVYMTGLFIVEDLESKGNTVIWNSYDCGATPSAMTSTTPVLQQVTSEKAITITTEEELKVTVMPNPSISYFTLKFESKYETPLNMRVMDASGRVIDARSKIGANSTIQIGHNYSSGTYYAEILQGTQRKVVQLIKGKG
jgi:hypothetical protein